VHWKDRRVEDGGGEDRYFELARWSAVGQMFRFRPQKRKLRTMQNFVLRHRICESIYFSYEEVGRHASSDGKGGRNMGRVYP